MKPRLPHPMSSRSATRSTAPSKMSKRTLLLIVSLLGACAEAQDSEKQPFENDVLEQVRAGSVPAAVAESVLYRDYQAALRSPVPAPIGSSDDLVTYARKCDKATGITVPAFSCEDGSTVPNQGTTPSRGRNRDSCDKPNVLNGACDPGSKFQVLRGSTSDAVAVAHCRKVGHPIEGTQYGDIAVIQYNKKNGAACFYQALGSLDGSKVPAPGGSDPWQWIDPTNTHRIGCTGCHDTGGFLRSSYLSQPLNPAKSGWNAGKAFALPNQGTGYTNKNLLRFVGLDYQGDTSYAIELKGGSPCTSCHNLAVNQPGGTVNNGASSTGTAVWMAGIATASTQDSRIASMGPWMPPGTTAYTPANEALAKRYATCAKTFLSTGNRNQADCTITDLGKKF